MESQTARRSYDHRLKALVAKSKNPYLFKELNIPHSNTYRWAREGVSDTVTSNLFCDGADDLIIKLKESEAGRREAEAKLMLLAEVTDIFDFSIEWQSLPDGDDKRKVLEVIAVACESADLTECLEVIKLSHSRLRNWIKRAVNCDLEDHSSCPKLSPSKITVEESGAMKLFVIGKEFAHFPIRALADHAKKVGKVYCSATSWSRLIKKNGWLRARLRLYPARPKIGLRAFRINQHWHVDATIMRLSDGTKAYLQVHLQIISQKWHLPGRPLLRSMVLIPRNLYMPRLTERQTYVETSENQP